MKRVLAVLVILCFAVCGLTASASAAWWTKKSDTNTTADTKTTDKNPAKEQRVVIIIISGKVKALNPPQNEIVITDSKAEGDKVFIADPDVFKKINIGDTAEVKFKSGTNVIDSIKVTKAAKAETKPVPPKGKPGKK